MLFEDEQVIIIFCLLIIFFMVIILNGLLNKVYSDDYPEESSSINSIDMNNGDLVFVSYPNIAGAFVSSFSRSIWSHTGMIWVEPLTNVRYVIEGAVYSHKKYQHFQKIPLETWLFFNKKSIIGYKKYRGKPISSEYMETIFSPFFKHCKLDGFNIFWARFLFQRPYYEYNLNSKITCIEFTVILGQELGIYKKDKIYCSYLTNEIVNNRIEFCSDVSYSKPIQIIYSLKDLVLIKEDIKINKIFWKN